MDREKNYCWSAGGELVMEVLWGGVYLSPGAYFLRNKKQIHFALHFCSASSDKHVKGSSLRVGRMLGLGLAVVVIEVMVVVWVVFVISEYD